MRRIAGGDLSGDALKPWIPLISQSPRISSVYSMRSDTAMTIADAMDGKHRKVRLEDCAGSISGIHISIRRGFPIVAPEVEWISRLPGCDNGIAGRRDFPVKGLAEPVLACFRGPVQKD